MGQSLSLPCIPSPEEIADLSAAAEDVVVVYDGRTMEEDEGPAAALSSPLCTAEMAAADSESTEGLDTRAWDIASLLEAGVPRERCAGVLELSLRLGARRGFPEPQQDPLTLLRFYDSRDGDVSDALAMWNDATEWRESFGLEQRVMGRFGTGAVYAEERGGRAVWPPYPRIERSHSTEVHWKKAPKKKKGPTESVAMLETIGRAFGGAAGETATAGPWAWQRHNWTTSTTGPATTATATATAQNNGSSNDNSTLEGFADGACFYGRLAKDDPRDSRKPWQVSINSTDQITSLFYLLK